MGRDEPKGRCMGKASLRLLCVAVFALSLPMVLADHIKVDMDTHGDADGDGFTDMDDSLAYLAGD